MSQVKQVVIVGGGASGFFAAIRAGQIVSEEKLPSQVTLVEAGNRYLQKVRISGGGRCNVTHNQFDPRSFCQNYPRGSKELLSPFHQFQASDVVAWFEKRGVKIKAEEDGRMFPVTDSSQTVIDCLKNEAAKYGVQLRSNFFVDDIVREGSHFKVTNRLGEEEKAHAVLLATGSSSKGHALAKGLGHRLTELAPSLFSFKIKSALLENMQGVSFPDAKVELVLKDGKSFVEQAPILVTHWGLSGPGILKLSAWAAREMKSCGYRASLQVNWVGQSLEACMEDLKQIKVSHAKKILGNIQFPRTTRKFWLQVLEVCQLDQKFKMAEVSNSDLRKIAIALTTSTLEILGKNRFKDEFVECGGVDLKEIDLKTMQSKLVDRLYFSGEIMDIDGITGGFNFQHAWTSGWISGSHMVANL